MHPRDVEKLSARYPVTGRMLAIELAARIGADEEHLVKAKALRGASKPQIVAYLAAANLQRGSGHKDKAAKLAILAAGKPFNPAYVRAVVEHAIRHGVRYTDLVPTVNVSGEHDPGSRGEREAERLKQAEAAASTADRPNRITKGRKRSDEERAAKLKPPAPKAAKKKASESDTAKLTPATSAASAGAASTPEPQGA